MNIKLLIKKSVVVIALVAGIDTASANITLTSSIAIPTQLGTGLAGSYYAFNTWPGSFSNALTLYQNAAAPTATFTATSVCFPSCNGPTGDNVTLTQFLNTSATDISANHVTDLSQHALNLSGYLAISTPGTYSFTMGADDGIRLTLGGQDIGTIFGPTAYTTLTQNVNFTNAGLYAMNVFGYEDGGNTAFTLVENGHALATSQLYSSLPMLSNISGAVPEPETYLMFAIGLLGIAATTRKKV